MQDVPVPFTTLEEKNAIPQTKIGLFLFKVAKLFEMNKNAISLTNKINTTTKKETELCWGTVDENIIATTKIRYNYGAIQSFFFPILR